MPGLDGEVPTYETGVASASAVLPSAPKFWSYSSLKQFETCPRQYSLSQAFYPELEQRGYPRVPVEAAMKGEVVHKSLEIIVKAMIKANCQSTRSVEAVDVLRELGGYTAVAATVLHDQLARVVGNSRVSPERLEQLTKVLTDWLPKARERIQTYLSRTQIVIHSSASAATTTSVSSKPMPRGLVGFGTYSELELTADDLRVRGRVDLLRVGPDGAHITDFKTGAEDSSHYDQLRFYALLWHTDSVANPDTLGVSVLVAVYRNREQLVEVPTADELANLKRDVASRVAAADAGVGGIPPVAVPGEHCQLCNVKGLCDVYWSDVAPSTKDVEDGEWFDFQGTVLREHGVKSWVLYESKSALEVLVRTPSSSVMLPTGKSVRILGVRRTIDPDGDQELVVNLSNTSEVLRLSD